MDTEIELKYLVLGDNIPAVITNLLTQLKHPFSCETKTLANCYFDTPDLALRKADIGLRIRQNNKGEIEQTIKTAGVTVGGLHQRPEYNITLESADVNLTLFNQEIWPTGFDVKSVQEQLSPLFETNFKRMTWLITMPDNSQIELAFDQGEVRSSQSSEAINEIELELVSGNENSIFTLAHSLISVIEIRPGTLSKAARGYGLVFGRTESHISSGSTVLVIENGMTISESFKAGFSECLTQLQQLVSQFVTKQNLQVLKEISDTLALARHGLWLYKDYLPSDKSDSIRKQIKAVLAELVWVEPALQIRELTTKKGNYRKKIEYSKSLLAELKNEKHQLIDFQQMLKLLHAEAFNKLQLSMLEFILNDLDEVHSTELLDLAPSWLSLNLDTLDKAIHRDKPLTSAEYIENHHLIIRSLLTGSWFGGLYSVDKRMDFRGPWLDIHLGIDELETLTLLKGHLQQSSEDIPQKLVCWLDDKVENLLCALEHCKAAALNLQPYWLK
ncbi:CYTH domain-containing protein [Thalassotalea psychrophila]|uniref:CYTH domain-containing protein n=1 Tax=Thalassotalea psychrophila TaxID=3065647 RepID=A0ABY9TWF4_9GAMM|nr:CYTH domain-containing protein [Colwelliaceae bacterium SQ149]